MNSKRLDPAVRARIFRSFTTRRVPEEALQFLLTDLRPRAGDIVVARVVSLGHHRRLHLPNGDRHHLVVGDIVAVAYGNRYAASQFEARVPRDLSTCHLASGGGIAAAVTRTHARILRGATVIEPIGLVCDEPSGPPLNVANWALDTPGPARAGAVPVIAFVGTGMDSGKTTATANLVRGLVSLGRRVGYAKVTGTGAAGDPLLVAGAGANPVVDFTDVGYASTYRIAYRELLAMFMDLVGHLQSSAVDFILLEVADGLLQRETSMLASSPAFRRFTDGCILATRDSMAAAAGVRWLKECKLPVLGLAGLIERAPLLTREARTATGLKVYSSDELSSVAGASALLRSLSKARRRVVVPARIGGRHTAPAEPAAGPERAANPAFPLQERQLAP